MILMLWCRITLSWFATEVAIPALQQHGTGSGRRNIRDSGSARRQVLSRRKRPADRLVAGGARAVFSELIPSDSTREQRRDGVMLISELMTQAGLTSVHQTGGYRDDMIAYQDAREAGGMRFRMYLFPRGRLFDDLVNAGVRTGMGDEVFRIGAVKFTADGSASERTMRMSEPYEGRPDDYGLLYMTEEEIFQSVENAHRNDFQVAFTPTAMSP